MKRPCSPKNISIQTLKSVISNDFQQRPLLSPQNGLGNFIWLLPESSDTLFVSWVEIQN